VIHRYFVGHISAAMLQKNKAKEDEEEKRRSVIPYNDV